MLVAGFTVSSLNPMVALAAEEEGTSSEAMEEEIANEEAEAVEEAVTTDDRIIPNGISIAGIDVSGKTVTEAQQVIDSYFANYDNVVFTLSANDQTITAKYVKATVKVTVEGGKIKNIE